MSIVKNDLKKIVWIFLAVMTAISFTNLLNLKVDGETLKLAGISVIIGIIAYFVTAKTNDNKNEGLNIKTFPKQMLDIKVIILALIPSIINIVTTFFVDPLIPGFAEHLGSRTTMLDKENLFPTIFTLVMAALGEEIAFRGFYQKQLTKAFGIVPALIAASFVFAMGHFSIGEPVVVIYDLSLVFINAVFYGLVFYKTDNAWCSFISHLLANAIGVILIL